jgi:hypothetical protein
LNIENWLFVLLGFDQSMFSTKFEEGQMTNLGEPLNDDFQQINE